MSETEFSLESDNTISVCAHNVTDGINLRELVIDGLDIITKNAIIDFVKSYKLEVTGVDSDTYTVDLTKWDRNKSEQFVELLKSMGAKLPGILAKDDEEVPESAVTETVLSAFTSNSSTEEGKIIFEESRSKDETEIPRIERYPIHPTEELDFEYLSRSKQFSVQTSPIFQKDELLNIKPMLMTEETQSTMGSANIGFSKIKKNYFSFKCVSNCISFTFRQLRRLKICRFIRKHISKTKSREEKMRKEKAFAVYTTLLEDGSRFGREFRESLKQPMSTWRTVATNTWNRAPPDAWSINSEVSKINRGINAVCQVTDIGVNTPQVSMSNTKPEPHLRDIPKVFSEPEEEPIIWCPCQFITSSFLYRSISKCLGYICDWEDCNTELIKQDIANQKQQLKEVRSMLVGALDLLEKARKPTDEKHIDENY